MIKNIRVDIDGFLYNIVQMSGEQAFRMQLKLASVASLFNFDGVNSAKLDAEGMLKILKGVFSAANPDILIPIVKELLLNCALIEVNAQLTASEGYNPERHFNKKVALDNFFGKDVVHLYRLLYEILKANYEDFFRQAQKWLASSVRGLDQPSSL